jgi:hypothetical protein
MASDDRCPLDTIERLFHILHDGRQGTGTSAGVARYPTRIDPDRFRRAVDVIQRIHPALRTVIRPGPGGEPVWDFPRPVPPIPVEFIEDDDPLAWEKFAFADVDKLFDSANQPLLRYTVFQPRTGDRSDVVLTIHHSIWDGRSLMKTVTELEAAYADPDAPRPEVPWQRGSRLKKLRLGPAAVVHGMTRRIGDRLVERFSPQAFPPQDAPGVRRLHKAFLSAEDTDALLKRARAENTSVYGALCAAMFQASADVFDFGTRRVSLRSAMDLRARFEPGVAADAIGCYVDATRTVYRAPLRVPFWELARRVRAKVQTQFHSNEAHFKRWFLNRFRPDPLKERKLRGETVVVNNLGVFPAPPPGAPLTMSEFCWVTNSHRARHGGLTLEVATVAGRLNLTFRSEGQSPAVIERLAAAYQDRLLSAVRGE